MDFQYYPTPPALVERAWAKFQNRDFVRVLEPHGGNGDLATYPGKGEWNRRPIPIDCCEIDIARHPTLRAKGLKVVGLDFLAFDGCTAYSHVIANPPFATGAKHLLKAWEDVWDAELVFILNAETIRNPYSAERQMVVKLIEQHGSVEFIEGAFAGPDVERQTEVEVALVYLRKKADIATDVVGSILSDLRRDADAARGLCQDYQEMQAVALPDSVIENAVLAFKAAVRSMRESAFAGARAGYYARLLGATMSERNGVGSTSQDASVDYVLKAVSEGYDDLKDRAWSQIIRSIDVTSRLSSAAQRRVEAQFEEIKLLEFSVLNIRSFLCGLADCQGEIQLDMACDVFDAFSRYHSDNAVFYRGWRSNDAHRTCGMRLKTRRFILPGHSTESYHHGLRWESERLLADFDKVFAMLDGQLEPEISLTSLCRTQFPQLRKGARLSSSYFDIRYYPGIGTLHFFPTRPDLVDRLNRLVGQRRRWLPSDASEVDPAFWSQYEKAGNFDKELRAEVKRSYTRWWDNPLSRFDSSDQSQRDKAHEAIDNALAAVQERHGIRVDFQLAAPSQPAGQLPLLPLAA